MVKRRPLNAAKYRVRLNAHLIGEVLDRMELTDAQRGVVSRGLNAIGLALSRSNKKPQNFGVTLQELGWEGRKAQEPLILFELLFILDDPEALMNVHDHGFHLAPIFGQKTQQAVRAFAEAVCTEVDRGFFRV